MGDGESPSFAEAMALQKAKQSALEEAGTYVESYTKSINQDLTKDEIQTLSGGVLQVEVIEKTRTLVNDGLRVHLKIRSTVTTDKMEELAQRIKGKNVAAEYKTLQVNYDALVKEVGQLKQTIANSPPSIERETALNRIREREQSFADLQRDEKALFKTLVQGQVLVADAKKVLRLSDAITRSMLNSGLQIEIGELKPTLLSYAPEQVELEVKISLSLSEEFSAVLQKLARDRRATEEKVSVYRGNKEKPLEQATLFRFPDTKEIREELWYLQESLMRFRVIVEFFGDKKTLGSCQFPYVNLGLLPGVIGVIPEDKAKKRSASEIHGFVASTSKYFDSEAEHQEFKRLDELVMAQWTRAFAKFGEENEKRNQPGPDGVSPNAALEELERREEAGQLSPSAVARLNKIRAEAGEIQPALEKFPMEIQEASKKRDALASQAWDRLLNAHPPLIPPISRIDRPENTTTQSPSLQSPSLRILNERPYDVRSQKFVMSERMLQKLKETTARLVLEKRYTYNPSSPSYVADEQRWLDSQRAGCAETALKK